VKKEMYIYNIYNEYIMARRERSLAPAPVGGFPNIIGDRVCPKIYEPPWK